MLDAGCWMQVGTQASCLLVLGKSKFRKLTGKMPAFPLASSIQHLTSNIFFNKICHRIDVFITPTRKINENDLVL